MSEVEPILVQPDEWGDAIGWAGAFPRRLQFVSDAPQLPP